MASQGPLPPNEFKSKSETKFKPTDHLVANLEPKTASMVETQSSQIDRIGASIQRKAKMLKKLGNKLLDQCNVATPPLPKPKVIVATGPSVRVEDETYFSDQFDEEKSKARKSMQFEDGNDEFAHDPDATINSQTMVTFTEHSVINQPEYYSPPCKLEQQWPIHPPFAVLDDKKAFQNNKLLEDNNNANPCSLMGKKKSFKSSSSSNLAYACRDKNDGFSINNGT
jgi:hypothetical protein